MTQMAAEKAAKRAATVDRVLGNSPDLLAMLGVSNNPRLSESDIRKAHRACSLMIHPDKCDDPRADVAFGALRRAVVAYDARRASTIPDGYRRASSSSGPDIANVHVQATAASSVISIASI